jgi:cytochrome c5
VPALGGKIQAIPGRINHFWFRADAPGSYDGQCAQLCGVYHSSMRATVAAGSQQQYKHYLATWQETIGKQIWNGVCATCHGNLGQGGYAPAIANNSVVAQKSSLESILRDGVTGSQGTMPPVGDTWTEAEVNHLVYYIKRHIYKAAPVGATSGG